MIRLLMFLFVAALSAVNLGLYVASGRHWYSLVAAVFAGFSALLQAILIRANP